jgi:CheY-like chemotaxis protein
MNDLILLVDDMKLVLESIRAWLEIAGFCRVMTFQNPFLALEMVRSGLVPSVVIADFDMPGASGVELIDRMREEHASIHGIIVSGSRHVSEIPQRYPVIDKGISHFQQHLLHLVEDFTGRRHSPICTESDEISAV